MDARKTGAFDQDIVFLLEHSPVFTLGRSGGKENLRVTESFLEKSEVRPRADTETYTGLHDTHAAGDRMGLYDTVCDHRHIESPPAIGDRNEKDRR